MKLTRISALLVIAVLAVPFAACLAADTAAAPKSDDGNFIADTSTMIRVIFRIESPTITTTEFAALPKTVWRSGSKYLRMEEQPDSANGIHGIMLINEPDCWIINMMDKSAQHIVDPGPTFNTSFAVFGDLRDSTLKKLEFGSEFAFFQKMGASKQADEAFGGDTCAVFGVSIGTWNFKLYLHKTTQLPARVTRTDDNGLVTAVVYEEYKVGLPLDRTIFAPPSWLKEN